MKTLSAEHAYLLYLRGAEFRRAMIAWAEGVLVAGAGGKWTIQLAGADFDPDGEVVELFRKAAGENGVALPDPRNELEWEEEIICRSMVEGDLSTVDGFGYLYNLWVENDYDDRLSRWSALSDSIYFLEEDYCGGIEPFEDLTLDTVDEAIIRESKVVLQGYAERREADMDVFGL